MSTEPKILFSSTFNFLGGVSGLLSLALIIWNGGTLWQMVHDHGRRIDSIEQSGSSGLREHVKEDTERVRDLQDRMKRQEEVSLRVVELSGDVKVISVKLDALKEAMIPKSKP